MMDKYEIHEVVMEQLCREVEQIAENIKKNQTLSMQELEKLDKMYHLKKSMLTCQAMEEADEYAEGGNSTYRGRAANGRYVSRMQSGNHNQNGSYSEGYERGYSEAMNQMNGYGPRRW